MKVGPDPGTPALRSREIGHRETHRGSPGEDWGRDESDASTSQGMAKTVHQHRGPAGAWGRLFLPSARRNQPCQRLPFGLWPLTNALSDHVLLLFVTTQFTVLCYSGPTKLMRILFKPTLNSCSSSYFRGNQHFWGENIFEISESITGSGGVDKLLRFLLVLAVWLIWLECRPISQKFAGSLPSRATYGKQPTDVSINVSLSLLNQ